MPETNVSNPNPAPAGKRLKIAGVLALVIIVAVLLLVNKKSANKTSPAGQNKSEVKTGQTESKQLPDAFPADMPLEAGAEVQIFSMDLGNGQTREIKEFASQKTMAANLKIYSDYFKSKGWKILSTLDRPEIKVVAALVGDKLLSASITNNNKIVRVQLTLAPAPVANPPVKK